MVYVINVPPALIKEAMCEMALLNSSSVEQADSSIRQLVTQSKLLGWTPGGSTSWRWMSHSKTPRIFFFNSAGPEGQVNLLGKFKVMVHQCGIVQDRERLINHLLLMGTRGGH